MTFAKQLTECTNPTIKNIAQYLLSRDDIKDKLDNPKKSLDEMLQYIIDKASKRKTGNCAVIDDDTVYGWAVHYYDEDDIKINHNVSANTAVSQNNTVKKAAPIVKQKQVEVLAQEVGIKKIRAGKKDKPCEGQQSLFGDLL
ncbi:MAG: hypothetical protein DBX92_14470 [Dielma fastidiosa]|jgi:hypothetical protein|nr:hypothetical protein [Bacillota bacterium]PWM54022.1 MAG: hypothetical protein DBX92_14470 [Dielma fastidiosa]DAK73371.1 MAG TPA: PcfK-like protein [Caudoviricetes sp.]